MQSVVFFDRSVSAYEHINDAHLAKIDALFVNDIDGIRVQSL